MAELLMAARFADGTMLPFTEGGTGSAREGVAGGWRYAVGHIVDVKPDGSDWGNLGDPRNFGTSAQRRFALILMPGVTVARVQRYLDAQFTIDQFTGAASLIRGRIWQIQWNSLPPAARTLFVNQGFITIGGPSGDFTWAQVQNFVVRNDTGAFDSDPLT